jgi:hypothetical protein
VDLELALAGGSLLDAAARIGGEGAVVLVQHEGKTKLDGSRSEPSNETQPTEKKIVLPALEKPTEKDLARLSERRSIAMEPLAIAVDRGFLWAFTDKRNGRCWVYTDERRQCAIRRRFDNQPFCLANGRQTKAAACPGSKIKAPLGYHEARAYPCLAIQEGGPNSLAHLQGKRARIFVDDDAPGMKAARRWAAQLRAADVIVDGFCFDGLLQNDGAPVNDLNDLLRIDADCWEQHRQVVESVMDFALERMSYDGQN